MVVVFSHEKEGIHQAHGLLQARVQGRTEHIRFSERIQPGHGFLPHGTEGFQQVGDGCGVVVGFVCAGVLQIGRPEMGHAVQKIVEPALPEWLQIDEVADVFGDRPGAVRLPGQDIRREKADFFLQPDRRTPEPFDDRGENVLFVTEIETAVEPADLFHN